ncbi:MAG: ORF6N domain-containing protein [Candidatus Phlomobacter fragariae]
MITTDMLAQGYGTDAENIRHNFNKNKSKFIEGKHYFKIKGAELEDLRESFSPAQISNKVRSLTLWTDLGASRHAKTLETDQTWNWFEALEDNYFNQAILQIKPHKDEGRELPEFCKAKAIEIQAKAIQIQMDNAERMFEWATHLSDNARQGIMAGLVNPIAGSEVILLPVITDKH